MTKRRKKNILDAPLTPALKEAARELIEIQEAAKIKSVKSPHPMGDRFPQNLTFWQRVWNKIRRIYER